MGHEKPIVQDNSSLLERLLKKQRKIKVSNPYESERHKKAAEYIEDNDLQIKALRTEK